MRAMQSFKTVTQILFLKSFHKDGVSRGLALTKALWIVKQARHAVCVDTWLCEVEVLMGIFCSIL